MSKTPSVVLNRGHGGRVKVHQKGLKDRQMIMEGYAGMIEATESQALLSGSATWLRSAGPDKILYGGSYLR